WGGLWKAGGPRLERNLFEREFLGRKSIQHHLFESLARAGAGEPSAFCNRRLDRMRERHELGVCSRLGLGHLGGERLRPLRQCLVRRATLSTAAPFSCF